MVVGGVVYVQRSTTRDTPPACPGCGGQDVNIKVTTHGVVERSRPNETLWKDGIKHYHNYDSAYENYRCENGHEWGDQIIERCVCGWNVHDYILGLIEQDKAAT